MTSAAPSATTLAGLIAFGAAVASRWMFLIPRARLIIAGVVGWGLLKGISGWLGGIGFVAGDIALRLRLALLRVLLLRRPILAAPTASAASPASAPAPIAA